MEFTLAVLGSTIFWIVYVAISFLITLLIAKSCSNYWKWATILKTGKSLYNVGKDGTEWWIPNGTVPADNEDILFAGFCTFCVMLVWPLIVSIVLISSFFKYGFFLTYFLSKKTLKAMPSVEISMKKKEKE